VRPKQSVTSSSHHVVSFNGNANLSGASFLRCPPARLADHDARASPCLNGPMHSGDDPSRRVRSMIRGLRTVLGYEAYSAFRRAARASQTEAISAKEFYHYASNVLLAGHPELLDEVIGTFPGDLVKHELGLLRAEDVMTQRASSSCGGSAGTSPSYKAEVLGNGLVVLREALDVDAQAWLVQAAFDAGEANGATGSRGFYERVTVSKAALRRDGCNMGVIHRDGDGEGENNLGMSRWRDGDDATGATGSDETSVRETTCTTLRLNQGTRGRVILGIDKFPERLAELCLECVSLAQSATKTIPSMNPTTTLVNFYKGKYFPFAPFHLPVCPYDTDTFIFIVSDNAQFKWHRDSEDPTIANTCHAPPIVSFTVGLSCDFAVKKEFHDTDHRTIRLNSGDVVLFGGESRMLVHRYVPAFPKSLRLFANTKLTFLFIYRKRVAGRSANNADAAAGTDAVRTPERHRARHRHRGD
jgi:hypothetical protein